MKILVDMNLIHDKEVNNISECNLLHNILNPSKFIKNININYSPILHLCTNKRRLMEKIKTFESYWIVDIVRRF